MTKNINVCQVCNNRGHCHCVSGWSPPYCASEGGSGGSVDSGPASACASSSKWAHCVLIFKYCNCIHSFLEFYELLVIPFLLPFL